MILFCFRFIPVVVVVVSAAAAAAAAAATTAAVKKTLAMISLQSFACKRERERERVRGFMYYSSLHCSVVPFQQRTRQAFCVELFRLNPPITAT